MTTGQIPYTHWAYSTGRAFAGTDAAHQPYRDPDDQTGYLGAIA